MRRRTFLKSAMLGVGFTLSGRLSSLLAKIETPPVPFSVYLTFDDGPTTNRDLSGPTTDVLNILKAEGVHATFFLHGRAIQTWNEVVVSRIINEGHAIGNHLWQEGANHIADHPSPAFMAQQYIDTERRILTALQNTDIQAYAQYTGQAKLYRRPGGDNRLSPFLNPSYWAALTNNDFLAKYTFNPVTWLQGVFDYSGWHVNGGDGITDMRIQPTTPKKMVDWILNGGFGYSGVDAYLCAGNPPRRSVEVKGGLIILMHDADVVTDNALMEIIRQLRLRGAEFHTLPRPEDKPNTKTVGVGYLPVPDPGGVGCQEREQF